MIKFGIISIICAISLFGISVNADTSCPLPGFSLLNNYCYRVFTYGGYYPMQGTWTDANIQCKTNVESAGAQLVSITEENMKFVSDLVKKTDTSNDFYWIGLRIRCPDSTYTWYDGMQPTTNQWANGTVPAININKTCVYANSKSNSWALASCNNANDYEANVYSYVCQMPRSNYIIPNPTFPPGSCGTWCKNRQWCYTVVMDHNLPYEYAENSCSTMDGHLASIHDDIENQFVQDTIDLAVGDPRLLTTQRSILTGLSLLDSQDDSFWWSDRTPTDYLHWSEGQPDSNNVYMRESCVEMFDLAVGTVGTNWNPPNIHFVGKWNDIPCDEKRAYICKKWAPGETPTGPTVTPPASGGCRLGWMQFDNRCFKLFGAANDQLVPPMTHTAADTYCRDSFSKQHASLVSIWNIYEQLFIQSLMEIAEDSIWIGAFFHESSEARWTDQSLMTYTNWEASTTYWQSSACAYMKYNRIVGKWVVVNSCEEAHPFVCVESLNQTLPIEQPYGFLPRCSDGSIKYGSGCFTIFETAMSWLDAEAKCSSVPNTHLVSLTNVADFAFITSFSKSNGNSDLWIGLKRTAGSITWIDGYPLVYTKWGPNEPQSDPNKACISMTLDDSEGSFWVSQSCQVKKTFICSRRPDPPVISTNLPGTCPNAWIETSQSCLLPLKTEADYYHGSVQCRTVDGEAKLASVHSAKDILTIMTSLTFQESPKEFLIGLWQGESGLDGYAWDDGSPLGYTNWANGEPEHPDDMHMEQCVYMDVRGKWHDTKCDNAFYLLCGKPKDVQITTATTTTPTSTPTTTINDNHTVAITMSTITSCSAALLFAAYTIMFCMFIILIV